jgi:hypothetical protein
MGLILIVHGAETDPLAQQLAAILAARLPQHRVLASLPVAAGETARMAGERVAMSADFVFALVGQNGLGSLALPQSAETDPQRIVLALALQRGTPLVPLLLPGAAMPAAQQLPLDLAPLTNRMFMVLQNPTDLRGDVDRLLGIIFSFAPHLNAVPGGMETPAITPTSPPLYQTPTSAAPAVEQPTPAQPFTPLYPATPVAGPQWQGMPPMPPTFDGTPRQLPPAPPSRVGQSRTWIAVGISIVLIGVLLLALNLPRGGNSGTSSINTNSSGTTSGTSATTTGSDVKQLVIGTDFPVSGADAGVALPAEQGVDLAIMQAQLPNGYSVTADNRNDEGTSGADPTIGKTNIEDLLQKARKAAEALAHADERACVGLSQ